VNINIGGKKMLTVYIGPNGYGKTTQLHHDMDSLIATGILKDRILFLESEIKLLDEVKDTIDDSKTMEYILFDILSTPTINGHKANYEHEIDNEITSHIGQLNNIADVVLRINGSTRAGDFISVSTSKEYKKLVKINSKDVKDKMGSGQRMQLVLELVRSSGKTHIFIDEPEKYSHPSLLHRTAELINILSATKEVYIATHSPKLLSMINVDFNRIGIINDISHTVKHFNFNQAIVNASVGINLALLGPKSQSYYNPTGLQENIKNLHYHEFLEAIFSKEVYLCEGVNDVFFIKKTLMTFGKYFSDYSILPLYGKHHMLIFVDLFRQINIIDHHFFDEDLIASPNNVALNALLSTGHYYKFVPNIEREIGYIGNKSNTVDFMNFLDTFVIAPHYNV
jgi:predicted ATPase